METESILAKLTELSIADLTALTAFCSSKLSDLGANRDGTDSSEDVQNNRIKSINEFNGLKKEAERELLRRTEELAGILAE